MIYKYSGLGNDYLVVDPRDEDIIMSDENIKLICNRNFGIGSDGILYGPLFNEKNEITVKIYNPDGSEAEKSGNGVRIFSKYLRDKEYIKDSKFSLTTLGGKVEVEFLNYEGDLIRVNMGKVSFDSEEIPVSGEKRQVINEVMQFGNEKYNVTCLTIGNPHCVLFMDELDKDFILKLGPIIESSKNFPNRINVQFVKVIDENNIQIEIYERGAGYTLASGSSSCAAARAAFERGFVGDVVNVDMPGGRLKIEFLGDYVFMTGKVENVFRAEFDEKFYRKLK